MKLFDVHTHQSSLDEQVVSIINNLIPAAPETFVLPDEPYQSAGIHPWYIGTVSKQLEILEGILENPAIVALGEAGLDKLVETPMDQQMAVFNEQICLATQYRLPVIIHCVKAWDELLKIKKQSDTFRPWVIHGFRGREEQAAQLIKAGFILSFGPHYHVGALKKAYPSHLVLETDTSGFSIRQIYRKVAMDLDISKSALEETISGNVKDIFGI